MDLFIIILSFILAYSIFVLVAVKLAKFFFPKIDVDDDEIDVKPRRIRDREKRITV